MYSKLFEQVGIKYFDLLDNLINFVLKNNNNKTLTINLNYSILYI